MNEKAQSLYKFIILCISTAVFYASVKSGLLWDLSVYDRAVYDFINNDFPYRTDISLQFVYHPYVLMMLDSLRKVSALKPMLMLLYLLATIFFWETTISVCLFNKAKRKVDYKFIHLLAYSSIDWVWRCGYSCISDRKYDAISTFLGAGRFFRRKKKFNM